MVRVALPPPAARRRISPRHHTLVAGADLFRIYDPDAPQAPRDGKTFRRHGPYARFDHHRGTGGRERVGAENPELFPGCTRLTATVVLGTTEPESPTSTSSSVYTVTAVYGGERALRLRSAGRLAVGRTTSCIGSTRTSVS
jgi:hypothetical protein